MPSLIWSPEALRDLVRLKKFLFAMNPDAAGRAVRTIRQGVRLLEAHPRIGRLVDGMTPNVRDWWIPFGASGYITRYRVASDFVVIPAVRHGKEVGFTTQQRHRRPVCCGPPGL